MTTKMMSPIRNTAQEIEHARLGISNPERDFRDIALKAALSSDLDDGTKELLPKLTATARNRRMALQLLQSTKLGLMFDNSASPAVEDLRAILASSSLPSPQDLLDTFGAISQSMDVETMRRNYYESYEPLLINQLAQPEEGENFADLSLEIGHVDQMGLHPPAKALDTAIRGLNRVFEASPHLELQDDYLDVRDKTKYTTGFVDGHDKGIDIDDPNLMLLVSRKRPIADILYHDEKSSEPTKIEIVKRALFVVCLAKLSDEREAALRNELLVPDEALDGKPRIIGPIIEDAIDTDQRYQPIGERPVHPLSAVYFMRHRA